MKSHLVTLLALLTALLLVCGCAGAEAIGEGYVAAPNLEAWGAQDNNGWSYLYRTVDGEYLPMSFYPESDIPWQMNAFASDPGAMGEMFFISRASFFTGELGTMPVYAYTVPADGRIEIRFATHGQPDMNLTVLLGETTLAEGIAFNTTGPDAGFTAHAVRVDAKAGDVVYLIGGTTGGNREGWVKDYSVAYLAPDAPLEVSQEEVQQAAAEEKAANAPTDTGVIWAPDFEQFGVQDNNGWSFLYKAVDGTYQEMGYYTESDIGWQQNAFASDPGAMGEMFFINRNSCFVGELGTLPVYAFTAPIGGEVTFTALTHGTGGVTLRVLLNGEALPIGDADSLLLTTDGPEGGFTPVTMNLTLKKGDVLTMEVSTTDAREAWIKDYQVKYNSYNTLVREGCEEGVYIPDHEDSFGKQNNNGWSYMFLDKETNTLKKLAFVRSAGTFKATDDEKYLYLAIGKRSAHPSTGASPVMLFEAPADGDIVLTVIAKIGAPDMSPTSTGIAVMANETKVWPEDGDFRKLDINTLRLQLPMTVKAGDQIAVVLDALEGNINYDETVLSVMAEYK